MQSLREQLTACGVLDDGGIQHNGCGGLIPWSPSVFRPPPRCGRLTKWENGTIVLVHQAGVGVLDFVNVVKVLLGDGDLVGDITSDGCELVSQFAR